METGCSTALTGAARRARARGRWRMGRNLPRATFPARVTSRTLLQRAFARIVALRVPILILYALLVPAAAVLATRIPSESAIFGLVMRDDPDYLATRDFQKVFPEGQFVLLLLESADPFQPEALADADALAAALAKLPGVT